MNPSDTSVPNRLAALRSRYTEEPGAALIMKRVRTRSGRDTEPSHSTAVAENVTHPDAPYGVAWNLGLDEAVGGLHDAPNPGDVLCASLATCQEGILRMIAATLGVEIEELDVEVTGKVDVRGTLNIDPKVRVGFESLKMDVHLRAAPDTPPELLNALRVGGEQLCVTLDTLRRGVPVDATYEIAAAQETPTV